MKNLIIKEKFIVLFREISFDKFTNCVDALYKAGVRVLEICFNSKNRDDDKETLKKISYVNDKYKEILVGAGTVLYNDQVILAKNSGAKFIVSPICDENVIRKTKEEGLLSIPGAYTPNEIFSAYKMGADFVKLYPLKEEDIPYFLNIKTPLPKINYIATGGINENNIPLFLNSGIDAVGTGASILKKDLIEKEDYESIYLLAKKHIDSFRK